MSGDPEADQELGRRRERRELIEAINRAYEDDPPTLEEKELLQGIRRKQRELLESRSSQASTTS